MCFTEPAGLEGRSTGVDFALFKVWLTGVGGASGERDMDRDASETGCGDLSSFGDGVGVLRPCQ